MDPRERYDDLEQVIRAAVDRGLSRTWTALPVQVAEDSDGFTVRLQPTIMGKVTDDRGNVSDLRMPLLPDVPVQFSSGGGFTITHPIKKGDEGIAVFSSRCLDLWWHKGGVQPQNRQRWHSLSDAMYIPGIRSKPRALGGNPDTAQTQASAAAAAGAAPSTGSLQIRSDDGQFYIELGPGGAVNIVAQTVTITSSRTVDIITPETTIHGNLTVAGTVKGTSQNLNLETHTHGHGPAPDPNSP